ncbi:MAG TPA: hypothetical protein VK668_02420 [Mucilaginibacter sp.]|nr:hypothetical protein [Mucilaginibacter sp.]
MKKYTLFTFLLLITCSFFAKAFCQSEGLKVVIIRHGEKPDNGDNLNCQGFNRSVELPKVLNAKFGSSATLFVPSIGTGKRSGNSRMFQTITPYAVKYNLAINSKYDEQDYQNIAANVLKRTGIVIMVWEHKAINNLAKALGVKQASQWQSNDFDSIWIITYKKSGKAVLTIDKEGLTPSAGCQF